MSSRFFFILIAIVCITLLFPSCSSKGWRIDNVKEIPVGVGDSIFYISKKDKYYFTVNCNQISLIREDIALIKKDNRFGYIDEDNETILPDVYKYATVFKDNMAWVVRSDDAPGIINHKGELKFTLREVDWVEVYFEDMARYYTIENRKKRYGFASLTGEKIVHPIYYDATRFSEGVAAVKGVDGKWGYIDKTGTVVLPAQFDDAAIFVNEHAVVSQGGKWGIIDKIGEYALEPRFDYMVTDGELFMACSDEKWGWCDINGNWLVAPQYEKILPFNKADLAPVLIKGKWAYVDKDGDIAVKRQFDEAYPFVDDLALVKIGDYYGFINAEGRYVINPQYTYVSSDYISNAIYGIPYYSSVESDR